MKLRIVLRKLRPFAIKQYFSIGLLFSCPFLYLPAAMAQAVPAAPSPKLGSVAAPTKKLDDHRFWDGTNLSLFAARLLFDSEHAAPGAAGDPSE